VPSELTVRASYRGGMRFEAACGDHTVAIDYPLPADATVTGMTPLQLLLSSLAACSGSTLALLLKRMGQEPDSLEVTARGSRRDEHPTVLTSIQLEFELSGNAVTEDSVRKALAVAEDQLCPVWAMLKAGTPISASFRVVP
jgi:putative redox protein